MRQGVLIALVLFNLLTAQSFGQTGLTRDQFAHFSLLTRASFFENEILKASAAEGVDPNILWTIAYNETRFRPWLTSPKNARGLMQFIPSTAARFNLINSYEPISSIRAGARYVKVLSQLFGGRLDSILAAYNSGEGTVSAYLNGVILRDGKKTINPRRLKTIGGVPPYVETVAYVGRGLKIYRWLISRGTFPQKSKVANFPSVISLSVARVSLFDNELGKVPPLTIKTPSQQQIERSVKHVSKPVDQTPRKNGEQNSNTPTAPVVYYDSRTGNRYQVDNGNQVKLAENGIIVITGNTRPQTASRARSTFAAKPLK